MKKLGFLIAVLTTVSFVVPYSVSAEDFSLTIKIAGKKVYDQNLGAYMFTETPLVSITPSRELNKNEAIWYCIYYADATADNPNSYYQYYTEVAVEKGGAGCFRVYAELMNMDTKEVIYEAPPTDWYYYDIWHPKFENVFWPISDEVYFYEDNSFYMSYKGDYYYWWAVYLNDKLYEKGKYGRYGRAYDGFIDISQMKDGEKLKVDFELISEYGYHKAKKTKYYTIRKPLPPPDPNSKDNGEPVNVVLRDWYFAEGNTLPEFEEYLTIQPQIEGYSGHRPDINIDYMLGNGKTIKQTISGGGTETYNLPRITIRVKDIVPPNQDVSIRVRSKEPIVCERSMYFKNFRGITEAHASEGAQEAKSKWYFAEGCTREGFETWLTMLNPTDYTANVKATYMFPNGKTVTKYYSMKKTSRMSINVANEVGKEKDVSIMVESDRRIVCERPIYFTYFTGWRGGTDTIGANFPNKVWYFAEGASYPNIHTWLCVLNPNPTQANLKFTYLVGNAGKQERTKVMPPNSRLTVFVNQDVGQEGDIATKIESDIPVVAERAMYFDLNGVKGGHCSLGIENPYYFWASSEGYLADGVEGWVTVANFNDVDSFVRIFAMKDDDSRESAEYLDIKKQSRVSWNVYRKGLNGEDLRNASVSFTARSEVPIVVEKSFYFNIYLYGAYNTRFTPARENLANWVGERPI